MTSAEELVNLHDALSTERAKVVELERELRDRGGFWRGQFVELHEEIMALHKETSALRSAVSALRAALMAMKVTATAPADIDTIDRALEAGTVD